MTDPRSIAEYERAVPGSGLKVLEKFFEQTAAEQQHRHKMECDMLVATQETEIRVLRQGDRGQWLGFGVAMAGLVLVGWLAWIKQPLLAGVLGTLDLLGLVSVFVYGRKMQAEESIAESKKLPENAGHESDRLVVRDDGEANKP